MRRFNVNQNPPNSRLFEISASALLEVLSSLHQRGARKLTALCFQNPPLPPPKHRVAGARNTPRQNC
jgi:hypothetical protein